MRRALKIMVSGAAGNVAYGLLFRLAHGEVFGKNVPLELQLLEIEAALPALHGLVMELEDCAFPLLQKITCSADVNLAMQDVDWALLIGAAPRKAGMQRSDLLRLNSKIFVDQGRALNANATAKTRVLVVGNPCNTNCLLAMQNAPSIPRQNFYAMSTLDETRARSLLAHKAGVNVAAISNMVIWGNHSATQFPDFYHAKINNKAATQVIGDLNWLQNDFVTSIKQRGAEVIKVRGSSSAASAANAIVVTLQRLTNNTSRGEVYSLACCANGEYGVDDGLVFSLPCVTKRGKVKIVSGIKHNQFAEQRIQGNIAELRHERDLVAE